VTATEAEIEGGATDGGNRANNELSSRLTRENPTRPRLATSIHPTFVILFAGFVITKRIGRRFSRFLIGHLGPPGGCLFEVGGIEMGQTQARAVAQEWRQPRRAIEMYLP